MTTELILKEPCFRCGSHKVVVEADFAAEGKKPSIECFCANCLLYATIDKEDIA